MAAEIKEVTDLLGNGPFLTAIVIIVTSLGWWLRKERVEVSKANKDVAENNASAKLHTGQADEIESLRRHVNELNQAFVAQSALMGHIQQELAAFKAAHVGLRVHFSNLILCESCKNNNRQILEALDKAFDSQWHSHGDEHGH